MQLAPMFSAAGGVLTTAGCASLTPRTAATVVMADESSATTTEPETQAGAGFRAAVAGVLPRVMTGGLKGFRSGAMVPAVASKP